MRVNKDNEDSTKAVKHKMFSKISVTKVTKGERCLDCGKKISKEKFAEQEGLCDKCYGPFMEDVSQEEYPEEIWR